MRGSYRWCRAYTLGSFSTSHHDRLELRTPSCFKIGELTRLITDQLILISRRSAVSLACVCRYLDEPILGTLWATQDSMDTHLKALPEGNREIKDLMSCYHVVRGPGQAPCFRNRTLEFTVISVHDRGDPSPEAWSRVQRYASWMHRIYPDNGRFTRGEGVFRKLHLNSPSDGWPQRCESCIGPSGNLVFLTSPTFSSPHTWRRFPCPCRGRGTIARFPAKLYHSSPRPSPPYRGPPSDTYLRPSRKARCPWNTSKTRCGPLLTTFSSTIPLSDAAVNHLIHLPRLDTWHAKGPPPSHSASSLPLIFPPPNKFTLEGAAAHG